MSSTTIEETQFVFIFLLPKESIMDTQNEIRHSIDDAKLSEPVLLVSSMVLLFIFTCILTICFDKKLTDPIRALSKYTNKLR